MDYITWKYLRYRHNVKESSFIYYYKEDGTRVAHNTKKEYPTEKKCGRCMNIKPLNNFYWNSTRDEWHNTCKKCSYEKNLARPKRIKKCTPKWANFKYIELWYIFARMEAERTGKSVHVDHIVPLKSKFVCGLHCEQNMQLLFAEDNFKKNNKYWPGMP